MVSPLSVVSEVHSSSSDVFSTDLSHDNGYGPMQECLSPHNAPQAQGSSTTQNMEIHPSAPECASLSNEQASHVDESVFAHSHVRNQHPVHIRSSDESEDASNTNHIAGSSSSATFSAMEAPLIGVMSICGMRPEMEDSVTIAHRFLLLPCRYIGGCSGACISHTNDQDTDVPLHFVGVYDGHGGSQVSNFCKERLHITLAKEVQHRRGTDLASPDISWERSWENAMSAAFHNVDAEIEGFAWRRIPEDNGIVRERVSQPIASETVGSTAVVAVIGLCQIIVANCGDSRAVLSRDGQAIPLSVDHKPNREDEMERIEAAGGRVISWNGYRVFGMLAMSRAIGDRYLKPYVIAEPEVQCISRSEDDECLILASDGLWDVMTNEEACEVARKCLARRRVASGGSRTPGFTIGSNDKNAESAATLLTKMALAQGSMDNISVVVVDLKDGKRT